jgi:hypothetical protein
MDWHLSTWQTCIVLFCILLAKSAAQFVLGQSFPPIDGQRNTSIGTMGGAGVDPLSRFLIPSGFIDPISSIVTTSKSVHEIATTFFLNESSGNSVDAKWSSLHTYLLDVRLKPCAFGDLT